MEPDLRPVAATRDDAYRKAQERLFVAIAAGQVGASTVPIRASYVNVARCLSILARPPAALAQRICNELIPAFEAIDPQHHYYPADTLHITIKGIRAATTASDAHEAIALKTVNVLRNIVTRLSAFKFSLQGVMRFPTSLVVRGFSTIAMRDTVRVIEETLQGANIVSDKATASTEVVIGNLTFCRFTAKPSPDLITCLRRFETFDFGAFIVEEIELVSCDEVCSQESKRSFVKWRLGGSVDFTASS